MSLETAVSALTVRLRQECRKIWDAVYLKPEGGIPKSDLSSEVQAALTDARTPVAHRHDASEIDNLPTGGGGGAGIDDAVTGPDTAWSSEKTATELAGKAPAGWTTELPQFGGDRGAPVPTGMSVDQAIDGAFGTAVGLAGDMVTFTDFTGGLTDRAITVVAAGSGVQLQPGTLYVIRAADGTATLRLP